jgi:altronate hydrolase
VILLESAECIRLSDSDNVLVLPAGGLGGQELGRGGVGGAFRLAEDIPPGHKAACASIARGGDIVKYGRTIGSAARDISPGEWVHLHNVLAGAWRRPEWGWREAPAAPRGAGSWLRFRGYRRETGRPGIRNELWVIPTVGCIRGELEALAREYRRPYWIDSVRVLGHPCGCSELGDGSDYTTAAILSGLALNPNAAGVLLVGLGCESLPVASLSDMARKGRAQRTLRALTLQSSGLGEATEYLDRMGAEAPRVREDFPISDLCVGVACGGNDRFSGLSANPLVGLFSDWLASQGGTILSAVIPDMFGAEEHIAARISDRAIFDEFISLGGHFRDYFERRGGQALLNPSPHDAECGITTPEERSLASMERTGRSPVTAVLRYGEGIRDGGGVQIIFSPGDDLVSCTALAGSGAQMILFATGMGTPLGCVVPTVKISSSTALARGRPGWIDFDAGTVLGGEPWKTAAENLARHVLKTASGEERTSHERKGCGEIAISRDLAAYGA